MRPRGDLFLRNFGPLGKHDVDDELLRERTVYGESLGVNAVTDNHRGAVGRGRMRARMTHPLLGLSCCKGRERPNSELAQQWAIDQIFDQGCASRAADVEHRLKESRPRR